MAPPLLPLFAAFLASSPQEPLLPARDSGIEAVRGEWVERRLALMGTWLELRILADDRPSALTASEAAVRALEATEGRLSTWRDDSELARLNRSPVGEPFPLSPALAADLETVLCFWKSTDGAFDPGLGALVAAWGLRSGGRQPSDAELSSARSAGGAAGFELAAGTAVRRHPLAAFEEGGFGKGIGLDAALAELRERGVRRAILDLGGQLALLGWPAHETTLADPRQRERPVLALRFDPGSLATSGNSERGIVVSGAERGHVLDPRTGAPCDDFGSLSVWASDATTADCLSKLYVLGPTGAFRWLAEHPLIELLVLTPRGEGLVAFASEGWRGRLTPLASELEIVFVPRGALPPP